MSTQDARPQGYCRCCHHKTKAEGILSINENKMIEASCSLNESVQETHVEERQRKLGFHGIAHI